MLTRAHWGMRRACANLPGFCLLARQCAAFSVMSARIVSRLCWMLNSPNHAQQSPRAALSVRKKSNYKMRIYGFTYLGYCIRYYRVKQLASGYTYHEFLGTWHVKKLKQK